VPRFTPENARERAKQAVREADRAEAEAWSIQMEATADRHSHRRRSANALTAGLGWLEVECHRCKTAPACRSMRYAGRETRQFGN
jgi:hypothetical protein